MFPADVAAAMLPPTFQILTGLCFACLLVIRFKPLWGKVTAFSLIFVALGNILLSQATAKSSLSAGAEMFTLAGISFFVAAMLVTAGFVLRARSADGVVAK